MPSVLVYYQPEVVVRSTEIENADLDLPTSQETALDVVQALHELTLRDSVSARVMLNPHFDESGLVPVGAAVIEDSTVRKTFGMCPLRVGQFLPDLLSDSSV